MTDSPDELRQRIYNVLDAHDTRDPEINHHCKCGSALGSHLDPHIDSNHRKHVIREILEAFAEAGAVVKVQRETHIDYTIPNNADLEFAVGEALGHLNDIRANLEAALPKST